MPAIALTLAVVCFLLGVWLSAFFSGSETGFYRASFVRLSLEAHEGDATSRRLLWFCQHPGYFVATTLVGNNIANYLTTVAIGLALAAVAQTHHWWPEVLLTLCISPVVFVFGELLPKNLYYRAPLELLRRGSVRFTIFYWVFLPISFPLILLTRWFERLGRRGGRAGAAGLGGHRLLDVVSQGRHEGLLTEVQTRMTTGVIDSAARSIAETATPIDRVLGVVDSATPKEILDFAGRFGLTNVPVRTAEDRTGWHGYACVAEIALSGRDLASLIRPLVRFDCQTTRLDALRQMRINEGRCALVVQDERPVGILTERGLAESLFRAIPAGGVASLR